MTKKQLKFFIEQNPSFLKKTIFPILWEGEKYWVKYPVKAEQKIWHHCQRSLAKFIPLPIIRPSIAMDAKQSLQNEIHQIKIFKKAGFIVPSIKLQAKSWICMSDIGPTLHEIFEKKQLASNCSLEEIALKAARTLAKLHTKSLYHGRAKMNDLTLTPKGEIGFIDFEESPHLVMDLESCQARDLYLFISSLARHANPTILQKALQTYLAHNKTPPLAPLKKLLKLTAAVKFFKPFIAKMSKDLRQAYQAQLCFEDQLLN